MNAQKRPSILIVDDEIGIRELLSEILSDEGYATNVAHNAEAAWKARNETPPDLILLDIWMPGTDGISLLKQWREAGFADVPVIILSGHATIDTAVQATRLGALEVLEKPIAMDRLITAVKKGLAQKRETDVNPYLQQTDFGASAMMKKLKKELLAASADNHRSLLIVGEANSGAAFFAQFLDKPKNEIVSIAHGVQLEGDIDSILRRAGNGMIIARLLETYNPAQQNGLLGLLREAGKNGAGVCACSAFPPAVLAEKRGFGDMLVSLLSRRVIKMPRLSDYKEDLPAVVRLICRRLPGSGNGREKTLTPEAVDALMNHQYNDDFAELSGIIRSASLYNNDDKISSAVIRAFISQFADASNARADDDEIYRLSLREAREKFEREYFYRLMAITDGNVQKAAKIADLERTYFYRRLKRYKEEDNKARV